MTKRVPGSFRDPAGFMFTRDGVLYRQVNHSYEPEFRRFIDSGLYDDLVGDDLLVRHRVADVPAAEPSLGSLVLQPDVIEFISHPFEWSPGQLRAAALATLDIQRRSIKRGMSLRDASAYNIQFRDGRAVLIDTLSFGTRETGAPWSAYGQFCRHFLAPLALAKHVDVALSRLTRVELDGIPLDVAASALPFRTRLQWGLAVHIHAHAAAQRRHARTDRPRTDRKRSMSDAAMQGLLESLSGCVQRQAWQPPKSAWRDYYPLRESYSDSSLQGKRDVIREVLQSIPVRLAWDLGSNTGEFSRLVAETTGASVISMEMDASAVELNFRGPRAARGSVLPLWMDFGNPTPPQGWAHRERASIEQRGPADVVLALALVHHLAIGNNVPLADIFEWLSKLGKTIVIEWVPKDDPMVQRLLATREDIFFDYEELTFEAAAKTFFDIAAKHSIPDSLRHVYVLEARQ